uniref:MADF domain-containing protein n=1 Tax=Meloidogyne incognita TaxID=6306 RepID=A0A914NC01_MELIC
MNKSDFDWNMFIEIVRECEFLWNMALEDHKDKQKCKDAWTRISEQVGVDIEDAKKKWKYLVDYYARLKKKKPLSDSEGSKERVWPYREALSFMDTATRGTPNSIDRRKRVDMDQKPLIKKIKKCESSPGPTSIRPATPDSQFGTYIGAELRLFEEHERDEAKMGIMQVLHSIKSRRRCMMPENDGYDFN